MQAFKKLNILLIFKQSYNGGIAFDESAFLRISSGISSITSFSQSINSDVEVFFKPGIFLRSKNIQILHLQVSFDFWIMNWTICSLFSIWGECSEKSIVVKSIGNSFSLFDVITINGLCLAFIVSPVSNRRTPFYLSPEVNRWKLNICFINFID